MAAAPKKKVPPAKAPAKGAAPKKGLPPFMAKGAPKGKGK